jgi:hypothetical protein
LLYWYVLLLVQLITCITQLYHIKNWTEANDLNLHIAFLLMITIKKKQFGWFKTIGINFTFMQNYVIKKYFLGLLARLLDLFVLKSLSIQFPILVVFGLPATYITCKQTLQNQFKHKMVNSFSIKILWH